MKKPTVPLPIHQKGFERTFHKSTPEQIKEMKRLYKLGISFSEIGRRIGIDRTTIYYWLKKEFKDIRNYQQQTIIHRKFLKKELVEKRKERILAEKKRKEERKITHCHNCGKLKTSERWKKTHFCSFKCFSEYHKDKDIKVSLYGPAPLIIGAGKKHSEFWRGCG